MENSDTQESTVEGLASAPPAPTTPKTSSLPGSFPSSPPPAPRIETQPPTVPIAIPDAPRAPPSIGESTSPASSVGSLATAPSVIASAETPITDSPPNDNNTPPEITVLPPSTERNQVAGQTETSVVPSAEPDRFAVPATPQLPATAAVAVPAEKPKKRAKSPVRKTPEPSDNPLSPARSTRSQGSAPIVQSLERAKLGSGTGLVTHKDMELHTSEVTSDGKHPESPLRLVGILETLAKGGFSQRCVTVAPRKAVDSEIRSCHTTFYVDKVLRIPAASVEELQTMAMSYNSLYLNNHSLDAALWSAGCVSQLAEQVWTGKLRNGFAVVRPPGHHACSDKAMGFCIFDNVAIAARMLVQKYQVGRVLILDWDVHHGNGIQEIFYKDPSVLYVSLHRFDNGTFYPVGRYGGPEMVGEGKGLGRNVNIGWPSPGMKDADYLHAFTELILPIAYEYDPDIVFIAAGYDAAEGDPLGGCLLSPAAYGQMTHLLSGLASGKVVVALEGGYNVKAISRSAAATVSVLLGDPVPRLLPPVVPSRGAIKAVDDTIKYHAPYWKCLAKYRQQPGAPTGGLEEAFSKLAMSPK